MGKQFEKEKTDEAMKALKKNLESFISYYNYRDVDEEYAPIWDGMIDHCEKAMNDVMDSLEDDVKKKRLYASEKTIRLYGRCIALNYMMQKACNTLHKKDDSNEFSLMKIKEMIDQNKLEAFLQDEIEKFQKSRLRYTIFYSMTYGNLFASINSMDKYVDSKYIKNDLEPADMTENRDYIMREMARHYGVLAEKYPMLEKPLLELDQRLLDLSDLMSSHIMASNKAKYSDDKKMNETPDITRLRHVMGEVAALAQIMSYAISEAEAGRTDYLKDFSDEHLAQVIDELTVRLEKNGTFPEIHRTKDDEDIKTFVDKFISRISDRETFLKDIDELNKSHDVRMCMDRAHVAAEDLQPVFADLLLSLKGNDYLTEAMKKCMDALKQDAEKAIEDNGKAADAYILRICRLLACDQLMLRDAETRKVFDALSDREKEEQIGRLAKRLEGSDFLNNELQSDNAMDNIANLHNMLSNAHKLAKRLNDLPDPEAVEEEKAEQNPDLIFKEEQEAQGMRNYLEDYRDIGTALFTDSKKKLSAFGEKLSDYTKFLVMFNTPKLNTITKCNVQECNRRIVELLVKQGAQDFDGSPFERDREDRKELQDIIERTDDMIAVLDRVFLDPKFEKIQNLQAFYKELIAGRKLLDAITEGTLMVPAEDGNPESFISCSDSQEDTNLAKDMKILEEKAAKEDKTLTSVKCIWQAAGKPLFSHEPCPSDIAQGKIGDCYFVSSLIAVTSQNPQAVRDMMTYNENADTVTVRFYDPDNKPVYVTVDNTLPFLKKDNHNGEEIVPAGSRGAQWVAFLEKAYMASGLAKRYKITENEAGEVSINSGHEAFALKMLLGPKVSRYTEYNMEQQKVFHLQVEKEKIFPKEYAEADAAFYDTLKNLYDGGYPLTCATETDYFLWSKKGWNRAGLMDQHAYSVVGFTEENGVKYIYVKNPHALYNRGYDKNRKPILVEDPKNLGVSKLEFRDFLNNFREVTAANFKDRSLAGHPEFLQEKYRILYRETVKDMNIILKSVNKENVPSAKALFNLSQQALNVLDNRNMLPKEQKGVLTRYFDEALSYMEQRDNAPDSPENEEKMDAVKCYYAACMIRKLSAKFLDNEIKGIDRAELISVEAMSREVLSEGEHDSSAKTGMIRKIAAIQKEKADAKKRRNFKIEKSLVLNQAESKVLAGSGSKEYMNLRHALESYNAENPEVDSETVKKLYLRSRDYLLKKETEPSGTKYKQRVDAAAKIMAQTAVSLLKHSTKPDTIEILVREMKAEVLRSKVFRDTLLQELPELIVGAQARSQEAAEVCAFIAVANNVSRKIGRTTIITGKYNEEKEIEIKSVIRSWNQIIDTEKDKFLELHADGIRKLCETWVPQNPQAGNEGQERKAPGMSEGPGPITFS